MERIRAEGPGPRAQTGPRFRCQLVTQTWALGPDPWALEQEASQ